jgi:hypothetical protein
MPLGEKLYVVSLETLFVAYSILLGCQSDLMAKLSALVIMCESCSWTNILGGHKSGITS